MKFYKFKYPYYAVIAAETEESAKEIYDYEVCVIDSETECKEITRDEVILEWGKAGYELHELVDLIQMEGTLLIDSSLS